MKALKIIGIVLCLALLLASGVATGAQGPLALRQGSGQASGSGGCVPGDSYQPACDLNRDNTIDIVDIMLVAGHWRQDGAWTSDTWSLTGNPNTTPGANFLGTTDVAALEMRVNNQAIRSRLAVRRATSSMPPSGRATSKLPAANCAEASSRA